MPRALDSPAVAASTQLPTARRGCLPCSPQTQVVLPLTQTRTQEGLPLPQAPDLAGLPPRCSCRPASAHQLLRSSLLAALSTPLPRGASSKHRLPFLLTPGAALHV